MANSSGSVSKISSSSKEEATGSGSTLASRKPLCNIILDFVVHELGSCEMLNGSALEASRRVSGTVMFRLVCGVKVPAGLILSCVLAVPVGRFLDGRCAGTLSTMGED
jgi:hypothetical protein